MRERRAALDSEERREASGNMASGQFAVRIHVRAAGLITGLIFQSFRVHEGMEVGRF